MVSSKSPCRLERWGQLLFSSHRRWQTSSESWVLKWFASAAPTSSSVMPRAAARRSPPTKGEISHRRSCARSLGTSACRWRSSSATAECLLGIKTGVAVCQEALQPFFKGQGQQVIHHKPCRQERGLGPFICRGGIWAIRHQASAHPPHPSAIPRAASKIGPCALRWGGVFRCSQVGFPRFPIAPPAAGFVQQAQALSCSALKAREALVRSAPRCRAGEPPVPYLRRCITGALQHHLLQDQKLDVDH